MDFDENVEAIQRDIPWLHTGRPFDKQLWVDRLSRLIADGRVPPSTVYMDGSHNPRPSEIKQAQMFIDDFLEALNVN